MVGSLNSLVDPFLSFAIDPLSLSYYARFVRVKACTVLFALAPATFVGAAIAPLEFAFSMALVVLEAALVLFAVSIDEVTLTMHLVIRPEAIEHLTI